MQFCVAIYGGYFGAGMGILMLAVLAFSGLPSFNAQNAIKNVLAVSINGVALIPFVVARIVDWRFALPMAVLALARRLSRRSLLSARAAAVRARHRRRHRRRDDYSFLCTNFLDER